MIEPIAIIGIGCRFPQAPNPTAFWQLLCDGVDAITEIPGDRWNISQLYDPDPDLPGKISARQGGFLDQVDRFDPHPFKISPREAVSMDPQQRLLLEVAWEALEDAGQVSAQLAGSRTGVFIGISTNDYSRLASDYATRPQGYDLTGNALNIAAGRLSYSFNFRGPSLVVDTACSSSLVAVHLACQSIWNEEATMAIAGGVNVLLSPIGNLGLTKLKALSPDGRCKAFDATADGYVRSEGAGCVVLKPLSQALADGDPIYATIRGSAVNHDGRSKGLTVPYGPSQSAVIRDALARAQVSPGEIDYIEAHGTGTKLGDPIEVMALAEVLAVGRSPDAICALGAVKSNIGHLEAAAGIAGLIKVALSLKHGKIPPSLHFQTANPYIPFEKLPLRVQETLTPWPKAAHRPKAGVSAFGFAGTNAHVVLEAAPVSPAVVCDREPADVNQAHESHLLPLSAHTPAALNALVVGYQNLLKGSWDHITLQDLCYTASARRDHHRYRLAIVAYSLSDLQRQLSALDPTAIGAAMKRHGPKVAFVFTGAGAAWVGMGQHLLLREPVFRQVLEACDGLIWEVAGWSLLAELMGSEAQSRLQQPAIAQPTIFALQVALARLWQHWGIEPKVVVGDGLGEVAAAYVGQRLSLRAAVQRVCGLSRPMLAADSEAVDSGAASASGCTALLEISPAPQLSSDAAETVLTSLRPGQSGRSTLFTALGRLYEQGQPIRWSALFSAGVQVQPLPLYPWQRERFWVEKTPELEAGDQVSHPLIGQPLPLAITDTVFSTQLSLSQQPWLSGHQVAGLAILPGSAYLDMALAASDQISGQLENISIEAAMVLPRSGSRRVQMIVSPAGDFRIVSADGEASSDATSWVHHASGKLTTAPTLTPALTLAHAQASCTEPVDREAYYQQLRSRGLEYGESFQGLQQISRHDHQALARVQLPAGLPTPTAHRLHPVLLDAGFQLLFATLPNHGEDIYLPVGLGQLQLFQPVRSPLWIHGSIHPAATDQPTRWADLHLFDDSGQCLAILKDLQVRRIQPAALLQLARPDWQDWLYRVAWRPLLGAVPESADHPEPATAQSGHWLLFADSGGVAAALSEQLSQQGQTCTQIVAGQTLRLTGKHAWQINPQRPEDWSQLWEKVIRQGLLLQGAVHLWGADLPSDDSLPALQQAQELGVKAGLALAQGLTDRLSEAGGKLWFVTRGTQAIETPVAQVGASSLWGLGRVIASEYPQIWGGLVDLAERPQPEEAEQLMRELLAPNGEAIAHRATRYVARLTHAYPEAPPPLALRSDGTYLITGGLGSLGRQLAQHLIASGAKHLVLLSRRSPADAQIDKLRSAGSDLTLEIQLADVTQPDDIVRVLSEIRAKLPPLRGIFHAAGILEDGLVAQQTPEQFERVLAPKVAGAWNLHQLSQSCPLDYFMMFSSAAAILGSPGQANYAAANSFLDSLAHYRQGRGQPALSVNWGAWATGGMAEQLSEQAQQRLKRLGLSAIAPETGLRVLADLLQQQAAQVGVFPISWQQFASQIGTLPPLLSELAPVSPDQAMALSATEQAFLEMLKAADFERCHQLLGEHLQQHINQVLRRQPSHCLDPHQGFFDLGIDSLISAELTNALQASLNHPLSSTLLFDYPTIDALATHLSHLLYGHTQTSHAMAPSLLETQLEQLSTTVDQLSDAEAEAELLQMLATL